MAIKEVSREKYQDVSVSMSKRRRNSAGQPYSVSPQGVNIAAVKELQVLTELDHPNCLRMLDVFFLNDRVNLVIGAGSVG